ncbi:error-prone DNA polymerase [Paucibacter sp. B51]|uniref:error-prone DNA polymerase n=1 Tax=Paucibacter sp. B51 TaxID=2993315 RepID=UPI0022EBD544|nr:error-prone DNA polymerase [Paucibacter sp. B51]
MDEGLQIAYAELRCISNFSFLTGASRPCELVERAAALGYTAIALTDYCSLAGVVRAHVAAKEAGIKLLIGSQFQVEGATPFVLVVLACNLQGYGNLCEFITGLRCEATKGSYRLLQEAIIPSQLEDCVLIAVPARHSSQTHCNEIARWLLKNFMGRVWLGVEQLKLLDDEIVMERLSQASELTAIPLVATGDVQMHVRSRKPLLDVMTAIRLRKPLTDCGTELAGNAERRLRSRLSLANRYAGQPGLLRESLKIAARCNFSLDELRYEYPAELVPEGESASCYLRRLAYEGAIRRWPSGTPAKVRAQIEHELNLIGELGYEHYFLTVYDIVAFARSRRILCQGRGSAANSAVCYCLGITEVDPARAVVLVERFISRERKEPPDIDVDFEHERREEVIQYLYRKYGRTRAALTAAVATYRTRGAIQDVGKALGFSLEQVRVMARTCQWFDGQGLDAQRLAEVGVDANSLAIQQLIKLSAQLIGMPRHLSQHTGGFVLTRGPLSRIVPIENASMKNRTVIEWDKDDIDALGLLKVDVLALGMLTAIRKTLDLIGARQGLAMEMQDIPAEDPATYDMICKADTVGVFQIESRAQRQMLPRLQPRCFYDLVVEVALVRPGPIQGGAVHPYLNRRQGKAPITYPSEALREALGRTLGVPVFQEQCMQIAVLAAGFSPDEADGLRRAMAAWKRKGGLGKYEGRLIGGLLANGYTLEFAQGIIEQVKGFSSYGFPESHAASFALLVYASCWLKCRHPAEFLCAMLNSQPLGFYTPRQLVRDAVAHGVQVRPVDVLVSFGDCSLEEIEGADRPAVRLGLRFVAGLPGDAIERIVAARALAPFVNTEDLARRAGLAPHHMGQLAAADALMALSGHRRQQVWDAAGWTGAPELLQQACIDEATLELEAAPEEEEVLWDHAALGLSLRRHPLAFVRRRLSEMRFSTAAELHDLSDGRPVRYAGLVTVRQQPETASGVTFMSLEDETGDVQLVVWRDVLKQQRQAILNAKLLGVKGRWQREGEVRNIIVGQVTDLTSLLGSLSLSSRDFH